MKKTIMQRVISTMLTIAMLLSMAPITAFANAVDSGAQNLAYGKPVKVYRGDDGTELTSFAANAIGTLEDITDGDKASYLYPGHLYNRFIYVVDLGEEVKGINKIVTSFVKNGIHGVPQDYAVAVAGEDKEWVTIASYTNASNEDAISTIEHTFANENARYIRVEGLTDESKCQAMFISEIEIYADPNLNIEKPVNVALTEGTTAYGIDNGGNYIDHTAYSGYQNHLPEFAIDGNYYNEAVVGMGHLHGWDLVVELPQAVKGINRINYCGSKTAQQNPPKYSIWTSPDGEVWEFVDSVTENQSLTDPNAYTLAASEKVVTFSDRTVKAVKFVDDTNTNFMRVAELEIYSDPAVNVEFAKENLALGKQGYLLRPNIMGAFDPERDVLPGTGSDENDEGGQIAYYATDGYENTFACAAYSYQWTYQLDLGTVYDNINQIELLFGTHTNADGTPRVFDVQYSLDGVVWQTIQKVESETVQDKKPYYFISFEPTSMRYIRVRDLLQIMHNAQGDRMQMCIQEIRVYPLYSYTPYEIYPSIKNGQTGASVSGRVDFSFNKKIPDDLVIEYIGGDGNKLEFTRTDNTDGFGLTLKPTKVLQTGKQHKIILSSEKEDFSKTFTFVTQTTIDKLKITTTSSTLYSQDRDNAIYPAFVDNLHYQSWTRTEEYDYFQLKSAGGAGDVSWTITAGKLPDGLSLSKDGKISGVPTKEGTFNFSVKVTDEAGNYAQKTLTMIAKPFRAKWHYDARFGLMTQWGPFCEPAVTLDTIADGTNTIADWEARVAKFNPKGWAADMKAMGAEYYNFTVMGGDNIRLWPSTTPTQYELKTQRNYVQELIDACHEQGIKFIAYLPGGGGWSEVWDPSTLDGTVSTMHLGIMEELINMGVDGFWIDSSGSVDLREFNFNWEKIVPMVRYLNPDVILGSNPVGLEQGLITNYPYVDFMFHEGHYRANVEDRPVVKWSPTHKKMSSESTSLHQAQWGFVNIDTIPGSMNPASDIIKFMSACWENGVTYTLATAAPLDGSTFLDSEARPQVAQVGEWVKANRDTAPFDVNRAEKNVATVDPSAVSQTAFKQVGETSIIKNIQQGNVNLYDSYAGIKFVPGTTPITVTKLGRYVLEGNDQVHRLRLVELGPEYTPYIVLREVELDLSTATVEKDGFAYADITPITLNPGTAYFVMSTEDTTDTFATPNISAMTSNYKANIHDIAWTDMSGTRVNSDIIDKMYYWPYMRDTVEVKYGGLTNFKAVVGTAETSTNLALGGVATMTANDGTPVVPSVYMNPAQLAIDGREDTSTLAGDGAWCWTLNVDLGEVKAGINRAVVKFEGQHVPTRYEIWTSENGVDYTKCASSIYNFSDVSKTFTAVNARYVRFVATKVRGNDIGCVIKEFELYSNVVNADAPTSIILEKGSTNPVNDLTNVAIPISGNTDTTGAVTDWILDVADTIKFNVTDAQGTTSTIKINGKDYVSGTDYKLTQAGVLSVVVTTAQSGKATTTRSFDIDVAEPTAPEPEEIGSDVYTIADGFIRKIEVGTTVNELLENVTPAGGDIKVYKSETAATAMRGTVAVGTGNVVKLFDADGNVVDSLTVVILGDVSGDGKINATDLISLVAYIGGSREYTEAQTIAANLQQPARPTINAQDLAYLKGAMDGSKTITQK